MKKSNAAWRLLSSPLCAAVICPAGGFAIWYFSSPPPVVAPEKVAMVAPPSGPTRSSPSVAAPAAKPHKEPTPNQRRKTDAPSDSIGARARIAAKTDELPESPPNPPGQFAAKTPELAVQHTATGPRNAGTATRERDADSAAGQRDRDSAEIKQTDETTGKVNEAAAPDPAGRRSPRT